MATMEEFTQRMYGQQNHQQQVCTFQKAFGNEKMLEVNFGVPNPFTGQPLSMVWMRAGAMIAYQGEVAFVREGLTSHGIGHAFKKAMTDEGAKLSKATAEGRAQLFLAEQGKIVTILRLHGDSITVNGNDLLAFEPTVTHKIIMLTSISAIVSGGLFNVKLEGHGYVAVMTHGKPICLNVGPGMPPVYTDPDATVAWSGNLSPEFKIDVQFKTLLGRTSGESYQMKFDGNQPGGQGSILVQPYEETFSS